MFRKVEISKCPTERKSLKVLSRNFPNLATSKISKVSVKLEFLPRFFYKKNNIPPTKIKKPKAITSFFAHLSMKIHNAQN